MTKKAKHIQILTIRSGWPLNFAYDLDYFNVTVPELAGVIKLSQNKIYEIRSGRTVPTIQELSELAKGFNRIIDQRMV